MMLLTVWAISFVIIFLTCIFYVTIVDGKDFTIKHLTVSLLVSAIPVVNTVLVSIFSVLWVWHLVGHVVLIKGKPCK